MNRKLEDIQRDLVLLGEQGKAKGFFNNIQNADKLNGLVEDVRDTIMDYQVCCRNLFDSFVLKSSLDVVATRYIRQKLLTHRGSLPSSSVLID